MGDRAIMRCRAAQESLLDIRLAGDISDLYYYAARVYLRYGRRRRHSSAIANYYYTARVQPDARISSNFSEELLVLRERCF